MRQIKHLMAVHVVVIVVLPRWVFFVAVLRVLYIGFFFSVLGFLCQLL